jgi:hypothetical protein
LQVLKIKKGDVMKIDEKAFERWSKNVAKVDLGWDGSINDIVRSMLLCGGKLKELEFDSGGIEGYGMLLERIKFKIFKRSLYLIRKAEKKLKGNHTRAAA